MTIFLCLMMFSIGGCLGALVLITHDREFCEFVGPTHAARIMPNGQVSVRLCVDGELTEKDFDPFFGAEESESDGKIGGRKALKVENKDNGEAKMNQKEGKKRLNQVSFGND